MLKSKFVYRILGKIKLWEHNKNNLGFSLIELIFALAIGSIILLSLCSVLGFVANICSMKEGEDEILLNGRYAIEYIKKELECAEEVIDIKSKVFVELDKKYKNNIGFVIMRKEIDDKGNVNYNYSTYYKKNDQICRIAANTQNDRYPGPDLFGGNNTIAEHLISLDNTNIDFDNRLISLSFVFKKERSKRIDFNTKLNIRCPVIY